MSEPPLINRLDMFAESLNRAFKPSGDDEGPEIRVTCRTGHVYEGRFVSCDAEWIVLQDEKFSETDVWLDDVTQVDRL